MTTATLPRSDANRTLVAAVLATVGMLFLTFTAAYLERRVGSDWRPFDLPGIVWFNAVAILLSSVAVEMAKRRAGWGYAALILGALFLAGQIAAWLQLRAAGFFLPTQAYGSFFYMLSGLHGLHVAGGLLALAVALGRRRDLLALTAVYWHFVGGVWIYVLLVLNLL
jgi:cytochrome c oxidase subunit 3